MLRRGTVGEGEGAREARGCKSALGEMCRRQDERHAAGLRDTPRSLQPMIAKGVGLEPAFHSFNMDPVTNSVNRAGQTGVARVR